ncbi:unnamed protein product [Acidithrix sp. C25]|nr:unnamed protein product [Acidithrix sp. C25]
MLKRHSKPHREVSPAERATPGTISPIKALIPLVAIETEPTQFNAPSLKAKTTSDCAAV